MLSSQDAWRILLEHAPKGQWLRARDLYDVVAAHAELDDTDRVLVAGKGSSTKWHRAVRNAVQRHKLSGGVEWQPRVGFRFGAE
jgi:menaquinone-dependent protoporphyrinogen IX oxidase